MFIRWSALVPAALLAAAASGVVTACGDPAAPTDARTPPGASPNPARANAELSAALAQAVSLAFGTYAPGATMVVPEGGLPTSCPRDATGRGFTCAPLHAGEQTLTIAYELADAAGRPLEAPSDRLAAVHAVVELRGRRVGTSGALTVTTSIDAHHDVTVTGLLTGAHVISGTSASSYDIAGDQPGSTRALIASRGAMTAVVLPDGAAWPTSGTVVGDEDDVFQPGTPEQSTAHVRSTMVFDGTSVVRLTTTVGAATLDCRFDLAGRTATTCS